jgi:hypothetical protein
LIVHLKLTYSWGIWKNYTAVKKWALKLDCLNLDPCYTIACGLVDLNQSVPLFPYLESEDNNKSASVDSDKSRKFNQLSKSGWFALCRQSIHTAD